MCLKIPFFSGIPPFHILVTQTQPTTTERNRFYMCCSPQICQARWMSLGIIVTGLACIAHKLTYSRMPVRQYLAASCNAWTMHTWKCKSCTPYPCAISQTRSQRVTYGWGALYSSGTGISCGKPLSPASTSGAPLFKSLWGTFPPFVGLVWPTSSAILANIWVVEDPGDLPATSKPLQLPPSLLQLSGWGRCTSWGFPKLGTPFPAHPQHYLCYCHLKWSSNQ